MIIDIKYHIASLAAVFLALAIGILIGMTMLGNDAIVEQQEKLTKRLETDVALLREESKAAQGTIREYEKTVSNYQLFSSEALPFLVKDRLAGVQVAVIETNAYNFSEDVVNNFNLSGAKVTSVTSIKNPIVLSKDHRLQIITYLGLQANVSDDDLKEIIALEVAKGIETGENFDFLTFLEDLELINLSGEYGVDINSAVIIGGTEENTANQLETVDIPLINYLMSKEVRVFGVEKSDVPISYMEEYQKLKISTVDNADTVIGQVALIWAMSDRPGNYGIKATAKAVLPQDQKVAQ